MKDSYKRLVDGHQDSSRDPRWRDRRAARRIWVPLSGSLTVCAYNSERIEDPSSFSFAIASIFFFHFADIDFDAIQLPGTPRFLSTVEAKCFLSVP